MRSITTNGFYWSSSPTGSSSYYLNFDCTGYVDPSTSGGNTRSLGMSLRCVQE